MTEILDRYHDFLEEVRRQSPLDKLVGETAKLKQAGNHLVCLSPFRSERTPSFCVYPNDSFHDFGSSESGDCFDFVKLRDQHDDLTRAADTLAERAGLPTWKERINKSGEELNPEHEKEISAALERRWVEDLQTEVAAHYHRCLLPEIRAHMNSHYGFTDETIDFERIGWSDGTAFDHLRHTLDTPVDRILKTGLFIRTAGGIIHELHEKRITFPYLRKGKAPYLISRRFEGLTPDHSWQKAKYKKSLVHSENHPYVSTTVRNDIFSGEDAARKRTKYGLITEGTTDRIAATQCGWAAFSPGTTSVREKDLEKCLRITENFDIIILANDSEAGKPDPRTGELRRPGLEGAIKTATALVKAGRDARIVELPRPDGVDKVDLNSFLRDVGNDAFKKLVADAKPFPQFLIERIPKDINPAELDGSLCPIYALIAACSPIAREAYLNVIAKRFSLTKKSVRDGASEFLKTDKAGPQSGNAKGGSGAGGAGGTDDDDDDDDGGRGHDSGGDIAGKIYRHPGNYYSAQDKEGELTRISNFVICPTKEIVVSGQPDLYCCNIKMMCGRTFQDQVFPETALHGKREFVKALQRISKLLSWSGSDINVTAGIIEDLRGPDADVLPQYQGVPMLGYLETPQGPVWVHPGGVLTAAGPDPDSKFIYSPQNKPLIADRLNFMGAEMPESAIRQMAAEVLPKLFDLNEPDFILPLIGWFFSAAVAPAIRRLSGHFPILWIWGTQGSSKSTMARDIFWRLVGVEGEPFSCLETQYAQLHNMSASSSIPMFIDEYTSRLPASTHDRLVTRLKKNYSGDVESRGRADLSITTFAPLSPICIAGEQMPTDPALRERSICASPLKPSLTLARRALYTELSQRRLSMLAGSWVKFALGVNVDDEWAIALAETASMVDFSRVSPRLRDSLAVVVFGNRMFDQWAKSLGIDLKGKRPQVRDSIAQILNAITESEDGSGVVKDAFDRFLEAVSVYEQRGLLTDGREYALMNGNLCLHLPTLYELYLQERRKSGLSDDTNGMAALRRCAKEKASTLGSYVVRTDKRVHMPGSGKFIKAVEIDLALIPDHVDFSPPVARDRRFGGPRWPADDDEKPN